MKKATYVRNVETNESPLGLYRMDPPLLGCEFTLFGHSPEIGFAVLGCDALGRPDYGPTDSSVGRFTAGGDEDLTAEEVFGAFGYETEGGAE